MSRGTLIKDQSAPIESAEFRNLPLKNSEKTSEPQRALRGTIQNGMALCHWSFDEGLLSVGTKYEVLVSKPVSLNQNYPGHILTLSDRNIIKPDKMDFRPDQKSLEWRRGKVYPVVAERLNYLKQWTLINQAHRPIFVMFFMQQQGVCWY
jgi:hypothetical protein